MATKQERILPVLPLAAWCQRALDDVDAVRKSRKYRIDMTQWHSPHDNDGNRADFCSVCFAGSVLASEVQPPRTAVLAPITLRSFGDLPGMTLQTKVGRFTSAELSALAALMDVLDHLRRGSLAHAFREAARCSLLPTKSRRRMAKLLERGVGDISVSSYFSREAYTNAGSDAAHYQSWRNDMDTVVSALVEMKV